MRISFSPARSLDRRDQEGAYPIHRRSFVAGSAALVTVGCRRRTSASQRVRLLLAGNAASPGYLPHAIAQQLNLYAEQGLDVTFDNVPGGTRGAQALIGGSADAVIGFFEQPFRLAAQGRLTRAFVVLTRYPGNVLITSAQSANSVRSVQDLKHRKVGVSDLGSQNHFFLNWLLAKNGVPPQDVVVVPTGSHAAAFAALQQGSLDAWSGFDPVATVFQNRHPQARILADTRTEEGVRNAYGGREYPGAVLYAHSAWMHGNAQAARGLARALKTALRWIHERSVDQIIEIVPRSYIGDNVSVYRDVLTRSMPSFTLDGRMPPQAPELVRKALSVSLQEIREKKFALTDTYTNDFISAS